MQLASMILVCAFSSIPSTAVASPSQTPLSVNTPQVSIPNTRRIEFVSKVNGHRYSISIALPFEPAPARGYGVLYVLDGDFFFASAAEAVRLMGNVPFGVVVVGIGYPSDPSYSLGVLTRRGPVPSFLTILPPSQSAPYLERTYDLTLPASDEELSAQAMRGFPRPRSENVGGLEDFLKTIATEVDPRVAALAPIDAGNRAIFGHSFGGLAVLHCLFVTPNAFRTYIIASPAINWNNKAVLADEATFAAAVNAGRASPRVLVTMGGMEGTPPKLPASWGLDPNAVAARVRLNRMVENGRELVSRLKALHGSSHYEIEDYTVFEKQDHAAAAWSALARGISFAFSSAENADPPRRPVTASRLRTEVPNRN